MVSSISKALVSLVYSLMLVSAVGCSHASTGSTAGSGLIGGTEPSSTCGDPKCIAVQMYWDTHPLGSEVAHGSSCFLTPVQIANYKRLGSSLVRITPTGKDQYGNPRYNVIWDKSAGLATFTRLNFYGDHVQATIVPLGRMVVDKVGDHMDDVMGQHLAHYRAHFEMSPLGAKMIEYKLEQMPIMVDGKSFANQRLDDADIPMHLDADGNWRVDD